MLTEDTSLLPESESKCTSLGYMTRTKKILVALAVVVVITVVVVSVVVATADDDDDDSDNGSPVSPFDTAVIMISIDGFRHDYLELHGASNLQAFADEGTRVKHLQPVFISKTFPNHYTLVTGMYAESHGIVSNTMFDPELGYFTIRNPAAVTNGKWWEAAEPIWVTAEKQGQKSACYFWPGSEAEIRGFRPTYYETYNQSVPYSERVNKVLYWLDLPAEKRPKVILTYFESVDSMGHAYGPNSPEVNTALKDVDNAIASLVAGLKSRNIYDKVNIIITADHGMTQMQPQSEKIVLEKYIDLNLAEVVDKSIVVAIRPKNLDDLNLIYSNLTNAHPNMTCWLKENIPSYYNYQNNIRIQPIICRLDPGYTAVLRQADSDPDKGSHGYDNGFIDMQGTFLVRGPAFKKNTYVNDVFQNIHVYPMISAIMNLVPFPNNGSLDAARVLLNSEYFSEPIRGADNIAQ